MAAPPSGWGSSLHEQDLRAWSGRLHELGEGAVAAGMDQRPTRFVDRFERYTPGGRPAAVAEALAPYLAGCRCFNFVVEAASLPAAMEGSSEVNTLLAGGQSTPRASRL